MSQERLFEVITVHCFWAWCPHTVASLDPVEAHDLMEAHYAERHQAAIVRIVGEYR